MIDSQSKHHSEISKALDSAGWPSAEELFKGFTKDCIRASEELPRVREQCARLEERLKLASSIDYLATILSGVGFTLFGVAIPSFFNHQNGLGWTTLIAALVLLIGWGIHKYGKRNVE